MTFKVAALGPIPRDQITTHTGERLQKYGCVLYTTAVLSALMGETGEVDTGLPICAAPTQNRSADCSNPYPASP